ncbi:dihydrolipoyl dehydrogenase family protein [Paramicrobacterium sp. CJ85]|uniref:dihydrolipoyl dehydrogenase family protein n=1 Tax=Paramicrobacterium sp. CJ85 TaxID=3445355 RepID=UPI003F603E23
MAEYDVIVIGAGPVGENVADYATRAGLRCVIIERELVGGECSYRACIPSKALLRAPAARSAAQNVEGAAQAVTGQLDVSATLERRDGFTGRGDDSGQVSWLDEAGIDLIRGDGRLAGERRVEVTTPEGVSTLEAAAAVAICTGSAAFVPPIPGLDRNRIWTSRDATVTEHVPASLAIIGGGVVAAELATAFTALGSEVTVIARSGLLGGHEDVAGQAVAAQLEKDGARVLRGEVTGAAHESGQTTLSLSTGEDVTAERVLVATGRTSGTDDLGLDTVGLTPGAWIDVDETMCVSDVPGNWLYAVGDVNHRALLTHQGKYQARAAATAISTRARGDVPDTGLWSDAVATTDSVGAPAVVFSSPVVAAVGRTSQQAARDGIRTHVVDLDLGSIAGAALHADGYAGTVRAVIDVDRRILTGMTIVGDDVEEMLHAATIAVVGEVSLNRLWHAVPVFPTMSEVWLRILEKLRAEGVM